jgi:hypothetical protein
MGVVLNTMEHLRVVTRLLDLHVPAALRRGEERLQIFFVHLGMDKNPHGFLIGHVRQDVEGAYKPSERNTIEKW